MRDHSTPIWKELSARGAETVAITPGAATAPGEFVISGIPAATDNQRNYIHNFIVHLQITVDPDAAGNAISFDQLYKGMATIQLFSPLFGDLFNAKMTRGAVMGHIIQVLAGGYSYPQSARAQIPASTDTDVVIDLFYVVPLAYEIFKKPHETAQWAGFFDNGNLTATVDVATVFDGDYAGAVTKNGTLRALAEYLPSPDKALGVPVQWREREITGGGTSPILKGMGMDTALQGVKQGCGLVWLSWLSDAAGIGLNGPDGVDNITQIEVPFRSQQLLRNLDPYFLALRRAFKNRTGPISGGGAAGVALHDGAGWPYTMAATPNGRPAGQATAMFLPIVFPGQDFETSKAQRIVGDHAVNFTNTVAVTTTHRFVSMELMEWNDDMVTKAGFAMLGPDMVNHKVNRKALGDNMADPSKLRYTRILFEK
jgi:hypothetical protein